MRNTIGKNSDKNMQKNIFSINNKIISNSQVIVQEFNNFFCFNWTTTSQQHIFQYQPRGLHESCCKQYFHTRYHNYRNDECYLLSKSNCAD